jgi:hypothetical protein
MLLEARRVYGSLKLIDNFGLGGKARACFRLSQVYTQMDDRLEGQKYLQESADLRRYILGADVAAVSLGELEQSMFNELVNDQDR